MGADLSPPLSVDATPVPLTPAAEMPPAIVLPKYAAVSIVLCGFVTFMAALYFARDFFLPLVLGLLFALTLTPIVRFLRRRRVPTALSATALIFVLAYVIGLAVFILSGPVSNWMAQAPTIGHQLEEKLQVLRGPIRILTRATEQVEGLSRSVSDPQVQQVVLKDSGLLSRATSNVWSGATTLAITLILALFVLASSDSLYEKIIHLQPRLSDKKKALRIMYDIEKSISQYLLTVTLINLGLGVAIGLAMAAIGLPNPYLWGAAAAAFNFLPYVGAAIGLVLVTIVGVISLDTLAHAALAPVAYLTITTIEGQIITPLVLGRRLELNPVAIFVSVAFWGWLWGLVGVFIAVPVLVIVKVFCDHGNSRTMQGIGEFLSSAPPSNGSSEPT